jgi:hypothetical protein
LGDLIFWIAFSSVILHLRRFDPFSPHSIISELLSSLFK